MRCSGCGAGMGAASFDGAAVPTVPRPLTRKPARRACRARLVDVSEAPAPAGGTHDATPRRKSRPAVTGPGSGREDAKGARSANTVYIDRRVGRMLSNDAAEEEARPSSGPRRSRSRSSAVGLESPAGGRPAPAVRDVPVLSELAAQPGVVERQHECAREGDLGAVVRERHRPRATARETSPRTGNVSAARRRVNRRNLREETRCRIGQPCSATPSLR